MLRIDKWLWAARFYKTRQLAAKAVKTGKIAINSQSISKPAAVVKITDQVRIKRGIHSLEVVIDELHEKRGSATIAQTMYHETQASVKQRAQLTAQLAAQPKIEMERRKPDKRGVRNQRALKRGDV